MRRPVRLWVIGVVVVAALGLRSAGAQPAAAATTVVYAGTLNASCYRAAPTVCKLEVAPYQVATLFGIRLEALQLQANGHAIWDFRTDVSNPPAGLYAPSPVALDFGAVCGRIYEVRLLADDTSQDDLTLVAQTGMVVCPQGRAEVYVPLVTR